MMVLGIEHAMPPAPRRVSSDSPTEVSSWASRRICGSGWWLSRARPQILRLRAGALRSGWRL